MLYSLESYYELVHGKYVNRAKKKPQKTNNQTNKQKKKRKKEKKQAFPEEKKGSGNIHNQVLFLFFFPFKNLDQLLYMHSKAKADINWQYGLTWSHDVLLIR